MDDDYDDKYSGYAYILEQREDNQRMAEEEHRRYIEEHPLWDKCRNHPEREAIDPHCADKQFCPECRENNLRGYADKMIERDLSRRNDPATWGPECDMDGYHDRPTNTRNFE